MNKLNKTYQGTNSPICSVVKKLETFSLNIKKSSNDYDKSAQGKSSHVIRRTKNTNLVRKKAALIILEIIPVELKFDRRKQRYIHVFQAITNQNNLD